GGRPVSACPQSFSCSRPAGWCTNTSSVFRSLDCDGDGVLDLTCSNSTGERWAILSQNGCAEDWTGGRPVSVCPQSFILVNAGPFYLKMAVLRTGLVGGL
ncbi:hypothetical protein Vretifemale_9521, partial [Volvox reticuliferus]